MTTHSGSILRKLQVGFALGAFLLVGLVALVADGVLRRSLEAEDAEVLLGQARALVLHLEEGRDPQPVLEGPRPEKADWLVLGADGQPLARSRDWTPPPESRQVPPGRAVELELGPRGTWSVLRLPWRRASGEGGQVLLAMDRTHEEGLLGDFRRMMAAVVLLAGGVATAMARGVARWGLRPLGHLVQETETISERNLDLRLQPHAYPRELQALVQTLNEALSRLQEAFLRVGALGAEMAHELRTPLQNLRGALENRAIQAGDREAGVLLEDCDRLSALIEQILFLARAEHADRGIRLVAVEAGPLLEEVRAFFEPAAEAAGIRLDLAVEPGLVVQAEALLLRRALHNLVSNAVRHTPPGGVVQLLGRRAGREVALTVQDTGPGLPPDLLPRIGMPFLRTSASGEGLGLGLAMVVRLTAMMGGRLVAETAPGGGARMGLVLLGPRA